MDIEVLNSKEFQEAKKDFLTEVAKIKSDFNIAVSSLMEHRALVLKPNFGEGNTEERNIKKIISRLNPSIKYSYNEISEFVKEGGHLQFFLTGSYLVWIYHYWEEVIRNKISNKAQSIVYWDLMGEIKKIRNDIIHHNWKAKKNIKYIQLGLTFEKDEKIHVSIEQFQNLLEMLEKFDVSLEPKKKQNLSLAAYPFSIIAIGSLLLSFTIFFEWKIVVSILSICLVVLTIFGTSLLRQLLMQITFWFFHRQFKKECCRVDGVNENTKNKKYEDFLLKHFRFSAAWLGSIESFLYLTAFIIKRPEFIAAWLVMKGVYQWKEWNRGSNKISVEKFAGRAIFNRFLIGTVLNVIISFTIYLFILSLFTPLMINFK